MTTTSKALDRDARIHVAGHRGLVGSAIVRRLQAAGCRNLLLRSHAELDLGDEAATRAFYEAERPDHVFLAAARVGGGWFRRRAAPSSRRVLRAARLRDARRMQRETGLGPAAATAPRTRQEAADHGWTDGPSGATRCVALTFARLCMPKGCPVFIVTGMPPEACGSPMPQKFFEQYGEQLIENLCTAY